MDKHLGCIQSAAIINKAALNLSYKLLCGRMFSFFLSK